MNSANIPLYHIFLTVARSSSISGAAKSLYISQPAVSKSIKKLEESPDFEKLIDSMLNVEPIYTINNKFIDLFEQNTKILSSFIGDKLTPYDITENIE